MVQCSHESVYLHRLTDRPVRLKQKQKKPKDTLLVAYLSGTFCNARYMNKTDQSHHWKQIKKPTWIICHLCLPRSWILIGIVKLSRKHCFFPVRWLVSFVLVTLLTAMAPKVNSYRTYLKNKEKNSTPA